MDMLKKMLQESGTRKDGILLALSAAALLASFAEAKPFGFDMAWVAVLLSGAPIVCGAFLALVREHDIRADLLVSLALIASLAIGEIFAAGEIAFIMQLGAFLEEYTVGRARAGIERLVALAPQMAWRVKEGKAEEVRADEVAVGDRLRVLAGEKIPADGRIVAGRTSVDEAVLTGESMPVDKNPGDEVKSGTLNQFGTFEMIAEKVGEDMALTRLIRLVQEADAGKAKIVRLADRWATWIVVFALAASLLAQYITGDVLRAVTVLVVFCPCALVLATPTAVMAAIGNAARRGFLVKEGDALERLSSVTAVAFDKTGTLTNGTPRVQTVTPLADGWNEGRVLAAAAALESHSEHPLGKAIVACHAEKSAAAGIGRERSEMDELLAQSLAIEEVHAHLLPEDKLAAIEKLAKDGSATAMIGDGINDAPALKRAFVGIAMGRSGDGIAAEAADIAITQGSIEELSHLFALSRHLMKTIRRNIAFSLALNFLAIALAVTGEIGPVLGALIHNTGSILVIISSALLLHWKSGKDEAPLPSPSPVQEEKDLAKRSFFATMKENCAATDARVLEECSTKDKSLGASFWSFLAKHSWG